MLKQFKKYFAIAVMAGLSGLSMAYTYNPDNSETNVNLEIQATNQNNNTSTCTSLANCLITISQPFSYCLAQPGSVTVKNNSQIVAKNIQASSTDPNFANYVTQNNNCPANLQPQATCSISFFTNSSVSFFAPNIMIKGSNTFPSYFNMQAIPCALLATIMAEPDILEIAPNPGSTGEIVVTNVGSVSANNVAASFSLPTPALSLSGSCPSSLAPGDSCNFTVTVLDDVPPPVPDVLISGSNTNSATVVILFN